MSPQPGRVQPVDRLRRSVEFQQVMRNGRRAAGGAFVVVCAQRKPAVGFVREPRLGVTVSRKVGNAVVRNRVKRRIREWFRRGRGELGSGVDVVVIGRASAAGLEHAAFVAELDQLSLAATRSARGRGAA